MEHINFGSCQYDSINDYISEFENNMPVWTKTDLYSIQTIHTNKSMIKDDGSIVLAFSSKILNQEIITSILRDIKKYTIEMFVEDGNYYIDNYGQLAYDTRINNINNIETIEECYIYYRNNSFDLWSANDFIMNYFYKRNDGDFRNNDMIAVSILWLLENNIVNDTICFCNFDT